MDVKNLTLQQLRELQAQIRNEIDVRERDARGKCVPGLCRCDRLKMVGLMSNGSRVYDYTPPCYASLGFREEYEK